MAKRKAKVEAAPPPEVRERRHVARVRVRARYDAAETTDQNRRHWANANDLGPDSLAPAEVRRRLSSRCRYECRNNSYAKGIKDTLSNDTVGTGPRLQMLTEQPSLNEEIEREFGEWSEEIGLAMKLRLMRGARFDAGECFGLMATNPGLISSVKLDISIIEPEQVCDPYGYPRDERRVDGIEYDQYGNPSRYWVRKHHPGELGFWISTFMADDFDQWPARFVLHYFRPDRPGQHRGIPDLTPAVQQFAELRRYSMAVIAAAETAADYAAVVESDASGDEDGASTTEVAEMDTIELERRMATVLPRGYKLGQIKAEQPTTTYDGFEKAKLREIARCLQVPLFLAGLDARDANMSSAYVVNQPYERTILVDRSDLECHLNRLFDMWLEEWIRVAPRLALPERFRRVWQWDKIADHADPSKRASATAQNLASGVTSIPREYAREGLDWESEQNAAAKSLGVTVDEYREMLRDSLFKTATPTAPQPSEDDEADDTETSDAMDVAGRA